MDYEYVDDIQPLFNSFLPKHTSSSAPSHSYVLAHAITPAEENKSFLEKVEFGERLYRIQEHGENIMERSIWEDSLWSASFMERNRSMESSVHESLDGRKKDIMDSDDIEKEDDIERSFSEKSTQNQDASENLLLDDNYDEHIPALDEDSLFSPVRPRSEASSEGDETQDEAEDLYTKEDKQRILEAGRSMWESYMEESNRQTTPNNLDLDPPSPQPHQRNLMGHYTPTFDRPVSTETFVIGQSARIKSPLDRPTQQLRKKSSLDNPFDNRISHLDRPRTFLVDNPHTRPKRTSPPKSLANLPDYQNNRFYSPDVMCFDPHKPPTADVYTVSPPRPSSSDVYTCSPPRPSPPYTNSPPRPSPPYTNSPPRPSPPDSRYYSPGSEDGYPGSKPRRRRKLPDIPKDKKPLEGVNAASLFDELTAATPSWENTTILDPDNMVEKEEEGCGGGDIDSGNSTSHSPEEWPGLNLLSPISQTLGQQSNNRIELLDPTHRGLHRFIPRHHDELCIEIGDPIYVQKEAEDLWCEGINLRTGEQGVFPEAHVVDVDYNDFDPAAAEERKERYILDYLGSMKCKLHKGNQVIVQAVQRILDSKDRRTCVLEIGERGIKMVEKNATGDIVGGDANQEYFYHLKNVTFCGFHPRDHRYFAFITKHPSPYIDEHAVHVYVSETSTRCVAQAYGRAFHRFYKKIMDSQFPVEDMYLE